MELTRTRLNLIFDELAFEPNASQAPIFDWALDHRFTLVAGGERAGKSMTAGEWGAANGICAVEPRLYWIVGAEYEDAKPEFGFIFDELAKLDAIGQRSMPQQGPRSLVTRVGVRFQTFSAHDPEKLGREAPDGVLMCEAGRHSYESFLRLRGRVAEKRGWMWISGTFEESVGWYAETFEDWQSEDATGRSFSLPSWSNTAIYPGGRQDPEMVELERTYPTDRFSERFAGVPVPPKGLVFKEFRHALHVRQCEWVPGTPVHLWIDPGYAGRYAVLFVQVIAGFVRVFDEIYATMLIDDEIINLCSVKPCWRDVQHGAIDQAARQHTTRSQTTTWDTWKEKAGLALSFTPVGVLDGIYRTRGFLRPNPIDGQPRLMISPRCKGLIGEMSGKRDEPFLGGYRYKVVDGEVVSEIPEDKHNHACKALAYGLVNQFGTVDRRKREKPKQEALPVHRALSRAYSSTSSRRRRRRH